MMTPGRALRSEGLHGGFSSEERVHRLVDGLPDGEAEVVPSMVSRS